MHSASSVSFFRNFIFGVEDSLVSTVGLLSGIAVASLSRSEILLTGIILILVEAFSMGAGSLLSESSAESYSNGSDGMTRSSFMAALIMFISYALSGLIPLGPYAFLPMTTALIVSVVLSVIALFVLGLISARITRISLIRSSIRMATIGSLAIAIGVVAGALIA